jgi:hypothetical protein
MSGITRLLDWRRELLHAVVIVMEACWLYPWVAFFIAFMSGPEYTIPFTAVLAWLFLAAWSFRLLDILAIDLRIMQSTLVGLGLIAILIVIQTTLYDDYSLLSFRWLGAIFRDVLEIWLIVPPQVVLFLSGLFVWWRGINIGSASLGTQEVGFRFRLGILTLMFYLTLTAFMETPSSLLFVLGFFGASLFAVALSRIMDVETGRGGLRASFDRRWLVILISSVVAVILIGVLASSLLSMENVNALVDALRPILEPLRQLLSYLVALFFALVFFVGGYLAELLRILLGEPEAMGTLPAEPPNLDRLRDPLQDAQAWTLLKVGRDSVLVVIIVVAILLVFFAVRRRKRRQAKGRAVMRESVWSMEDFGQDLTAWLRGSWQELQDAAASGLARVRGERFALSSIREIYASLVRLAAQQGMPRDPAMTPFEFARVLRVHWAGHGEDINWLTQAYVRSHYGQRPDASEELAHARRIWEALRQASADGDRTSS